MLVEVFKPTKFQNKNDFSLLFKNGFGVIQGGVLIPQLFNDFR